MKAALHYFIAVCLLGSVISGTDFYSHKDEYEGDSDLKAEYYGRKP